MAIVPAMFRGAWWGLRLRCPECHQGKMFRGRYKALARCPSCGYDFLPGRGEFTGALMLAQGVLLVAGALLYVYLRAATDVDPVLAAFALVGFLVVAPIVAYPHLRGIWVGILRGGRQG